MRVKVDRRAEGLDHGHHAGTDLLSGRGDHHGPNGLPCGAAQIAQQLLMAQKVWAQHLGDGEQPLGMSHRFEHILAQPVRRLGRDLARRMTAIADAYDAIDGAAIPGAPRPGRGVRATEETVGNVLRSGSDCQFHASDR